MKVLADHIVSGRAVGMGYGNAVKIAVLCCRKAFSRKWSGDDSKK